MWTHTEYLMIWAEASILKQIKQMDLVAGNMPPGQLRIIALNLEDCNNDLKDLKKKVRRACLSVSTEDMIIPELVCTALSGSEKMYISVFVAKHFG